MKTLEALTFDNAYGKLAPGFHERHEPTPLSNAHLIHGNAAAARLIELDPAELQRPELVQYFNGEKRLPGSEPLAMCYAGHQFGTYVPRLGDGRALLLGQVRTGQGQRWDLHVKGAGPTRYSRNGDGRAVLRSTVREYLCSEAMHSLGIPSSRALCMLGSDEEVFREEIETGALLVRMASSHIRFGSFEYFYYSNQFDALRRLADFVLDEHYPQLRDQDDPYLALLSEVVSRTAQLIAHWQAVGFAHGVMNTDNMSILGFTLDYGPFGFLDAYDPHFVCNHSDYQGRYAFDRQPQVGLFNLTCLAQAWLPLLSEDGEEAVEKAKQALALYQPVFARRHGEHMRAKLGLREARGQDQALCNELLEHMARERVDYTGFFRALCGFDEQNVNDNQALRRLFKSDDFNGWALRYAERLRSEASDRAERAARMRAVNPKYVLRNHLAQEAIAAAQQGDYGVIERLFSILAHPFDEQPEHERCAQPPAPDAPAVVVSCSS